MFFSPKGDLVATRDYSNTVQLFRLPPTGRCLFTFPTTAPASLLRLILPGGAWPPRVNGDQLRIWQLDKGPVYRTLPQDATVERQAADLAVTINRDGRLLAAGSGRKGSPFGCSSVRSRSDSCR